MAVGYDDDPIVSFDDWYVSRVENERDGALEMRGLSDYANAMLNRYKRYKREMDARCQNYYKLELLADGEVISPKPDLPNVSSGETAGLVRRMARNLVQHTPNVEVVSKFDDDSVEGIFARHILMTKIIGSDEYSNDMQQNLFASAKTGLTLGFDCVTPCLLQDAAGAWFMQYDVIHYRDVFPEPGAKDVRRATDVFVRRYLTKGEVKQLIRTQPAGWDIAALKALLKANPKPPNREHQSNSLQDKKRHQLAEGYEVVTWYSTGGADFLTFCPTTGLLYRIERNVHPLKQHPVFFLVLEKDPLQPLGKSQVELVLGRQEFQDLMHNGAMKLWYRNINPSIIGYGTVNSIPNLSPGKYTAISNPNAKIEPFEVNTQTLMQYTSIAQANHGSMINLVGAADQQMAQSAGNGMSATPQGVEAQQQMVDITTNNYQKAIESFFSHYCSYSLTVYFQELKGVKKVCPSADSRRSLINAGIPADMFDDEGVLEIDFENLATEWFVKCVPGSLVEMEDEKQLRILNELFVPLSQAMPALAATQDPAVLAKAAATMEFIIAKEIELSGSNSSAAMKELFTNGKSSVSQEKVESADSVDDQLSEITSASLDGMEALNTVLGNLMEQMTLMHQTQKEMMKHVGMDTGESDAQPNNPAGNTAPVPA